jgi:small GTP-binding protein
MRSADAFLFVYDVASKLGYSQLPDFYDSILKAKEAEWVPVVLVANKIDLPEKDRVLTKEDGLALAKKFNDCPFFEASAKKRINIDESFEALIRILLKLRPKPKKEKRKKSGFFLSSTNAEEFEEDLANFTK